MSDPQALIDGAEEACALGEFEDAAENARRAIAALEAAAEIDRALLANACRLAALADQCAGHVAEAAPYADRAIALYGPIPRQLREGRA